MKSILPYLILCLTLPGGVHAQQLRETADPYYQPKPGSQDSPGTGIAKAADSQGEQKAAIRPTANSDFQNPSGELQRSSTFRPPAGAPVPSAGAFRPGSLSLAAQERVPSSPSSATPAVNPDNPREATKGPAAVAQRPLAPNHALKDAPPNPAEQLASQEDAYEPARVLARVGGEPIFVSDLSVEAMQLVDKFMGSAPTAVKQHEVKNLIPRLLPKYIQSKLLLVDAIDGLPDGANVEDIFESAGKQFDELMVPKLMDNVEVDSSAELDAYYRGLGSSLRSVKKSWIENELVMYTMRSKINVEPDVSHREMHDFYVANKEQYAVPAKVRWEQLLVRFDKFPSREAARAAIQEMGDEVVYGAPLSAVAKRSSQGFKAQEGGQQGWTNKGSLVDQRLDNLLFTIDPGKLSEIIETQLGLAIVRVLERTEDGFVPFETAQSEIKQKILGEKKEQEYQRYIAKVKQRIPVEIFDPVFLANQPDKELR